MISRRGFTLIEVLIVLAIIATIMAVAAPRLFRSNVNIRSIVHKISVQAREVRNRARLTNSTYRIVIQMDGESQQYWVERANGPQPIDPKAIEEALAREKDKSEGAPPPAFQEDKSVIKERISLPKNLRFASVETNSQPNPITTGQAYIHFFPQGFVEASAIQITDGQKLTWTLLLNPLTGQADVIEKALTLKEVQR